MPIESPNVTVVPTAGPTESKEVYIELMEVNASLTLKTRGYRRDAAGRVMRLGEFVSYSSQKYPFTDLYNTIIAQLNIIAPGTGRVLVIIPYLTNAGKDFDARLTVQGKNTAGVQGPLLVSNSMYTDPALATALGTVAAAVQNVVTTLSL